MDWLKLFEGVNREPPVKELRAVTVDDLIAALERSRVVEVLPVPEFCHPRDLREKLHGK